MISFRCPYCRSRLDALEYDAGTLARCETCGGTVDVPQPSSDIPTWVLGNQGKKWGIFAIFLLTPNVVGAYFLVAKHYHEYQQSIGAVNVQAEPEKLVPQPLNQAPQAKVEPKVQVQPKKVEHPAPPQRPLPPLKRTLANQRLDRFRTASAADIYNGTALNSLLEDLRRHVGKSKKANGTPVMLSEETLSKINILAAYGQYQKFVAGGKNVQELVEFMVASKLRFAAATGRNREHYRAVYSAMVAFDRACNAAPRADVAKK